MEEDAESQLDDGPSTDSLWQAERVRLRAIELADWTEYHAWDWEDDQARNLAAVLFPRSEESARRWAESRSERGPRR